MKTTVYRSLTRSAALVATALALGACTLLQQPATPEDAVQMRAQARWDALMKGDFKKGYGYAPPSYRGLTPYETYRAKFGSGLQWRSVNVVGATCEPEQCKVKVRVEAAVPLLMPGTRGRMHDVTSYFDEVWIREEGQWWIRESL